jgi:hypothetical protein
MSVEAKTNRRIEFKTKTEEQKILFEQKAEEMKFKSLSEMARYALEKLIDGSDVSSPELMILNQKLKEKDERILELESSLTKRENAYNYLRGENEELRIQNYGSIHGLHAVLMSRQIDEFIKTQNGVSRAEILNSIERPFELQGLAEFLAEYIQNLFDEGKIIEMKDGEKEVLRWIK